MNLNKHDAQTEMEMNMTPMIDVVFLLIIFFMIITDLTQQDLEELQLPVAVTCVADKPDPEEWRPIINVDHNGKMIYKRDVYYDPEVNADRSEITYLLSTFSQRMERKFDAQVGREIPDDPLLIRADENTPFKYVQQIMEICGDENISIWKLQLAAKEPDPNRAPAQ